MYRFQIVFIHPPVDGHLNGFYNLALAPSVAVKHAYVGISLYWLLQIFTREWCVVGSWDSSFLVPWVTLILSSAVAGLACISPKCMKILHIQTVVFCSRALLCVPAVPCSSCWTAWLSLLQEGCCGGVWSSVHVLLWIQPRCWCEPAAGACIMLACISACLLWMINYTAGVLWHLHWPFQGTAINWFIWACQGVGIYLWGQ